MKFIWVNQIFSGAKIVRTDCMVEYDDKQIQVGHVKLWTDDGTVIEYAGFVPDDREPKIFSTLDEAKLWVEKAYDAKDTASVVYIDQARADELGLKKTGWYYSDTYKRLTIKECQELGYNHYK